MRRWRRFGRGVDHRHHDAQRADIERPGDEVIFAARNTHHRDEPGPRHSAICTFSVSKPSPVCSMSKITNSAPALLQICGGARREELEHHRAERAAARGEGGFDRIVANGHRLGGASASAVPVTPIAGIAAVGNRSTFVDGSSMARSATADRFGSRTKRLIRADRGRLVQIVPQFFASGPARGLIGAIGEWVLRTACKQAKAWQDIGLSRLRMAVNLSARQFRQPNFPLIATYMPRRCL